MKRSIFVVTVLFLMFLMVGSGEAQKPPQGFFGLNWGDDIVRFHELGIGIGCVLDNCEDYRQGQTTFKGQGIFEGEFSKWEEGSYVFYKGEFYCYWQSFYLMELGFIEYKKKLIAKYGKPALVQDIIYLINSKAIIGQSISWNIKGIHIMFEWDKTRGYGGRANIFYTYTPIENHMEKDESNKIKIP